VRNNEHRASYDYDYGNYERRHLDLCALQNVDVVLIIENRKYIAYDKNIWAFNVNGKAYGAPLLLTNYIKILPTDFRRLLASQTPSGDIVLFTNQEIYPVKYLSFDLVHGREASSISDSPQAQESMLQ